MWMPVPAGQDPVSFKSYQSFNHALRIEGTCCLSTQETRITRLFVATLLELIRSNDSMSSIILGHDDDDLIVDVDAATHV